MPPRVISHYRVIRPLGAGGMGEVFLAEDTTGNIMVLTRHLEPSPLAPRPRPLRFWTLIGTIHLRLGETNEALAQFERAADAHDVYIAWIQAEPRFDSLRKKPRYQAVLRKLNLQK